jgi:hypothetical protein
MATSNAIKLTSTNKNGGKSFKMGRRNWHISWTIFVQFNKKYNILNVKCSESQNWVTNFSQFVVHHHVNTYTCHCPHTQVKYWGTLFHYTWHPNYFVLCVSLMNICFCFGCHASLGLNSLLYMNRSFLKTKSETLQHKQRIRPLKHKITQTTLKAYT